MMNSIARQLEIFLVANELIWPHSLETFKGPRVGENIALANSWQGFNLFFFCSKQGQY